LALLEGAAVLLFVFPARSFGRVAVVAAFIALCTLTPSLRAGAIATAEASLIGPGFDLISCDQTSANGSEEQCNLNSPGAIASAASSASASFGVLAVSAGAGSFDNNIWEAVGEATASFSSSVGFSQTAGEITGTWFVSYTEGGSITGFAPGELTIMGVPIAFPSCGVYEEECEGGFFIPVTFGYSGGAINVSAMAEVIDAAPYSEYSSISLQLIGLSSSDTMLPEVPEPGTFGLTGIALLALPLVRRMRRGGRRGTISP
jgi:hypothetical protein